MPVFIIYPFKTKNTYRTCCWLCSCYMGHLVLFSIVKHNDRTVQKKHAKTQGRSANASFGG
ncbi:hypothetical protein ES288_D09G263200v1 [Gossypium darwinii]|uniref:Uncharacterized protein n=1 Tax=Gossypium darwinii TaxID=34276 RepID=A0A5D2BED6_GOSDA|nr:hypothetical protein ES288_D09G263200v1 [Gossypium darwinii]